MRARESALDSDQGLGNDERTCLMARDGDAQVAFWGTKDTNKKKNQTLTPTHTQQHTRYLLKIRGGQGYSEKLKVLWD